jgi:hypothetical protein
MSTQVVTYQVDESTSARFEVDSIDGFGPAGTGQICGRVRDAVEPAVQAARAVLDRVQEVGPDEVEVRFGVKVSGGADWLVARSAGEASFEITLTWRPNASRARAAISAVDGADAKVVTDHSSSNTGASGSDGE